MTDGLPSFLVIGAVKAATTWISHQLRCHPDLWLPDAEPHFFSTEYERGFGWYGRLFAPAPPGRRVGEKSADYLAHPDAAARIAAVLPCIPLVAQLRNPVDRAYSDYCMLFRRGMVGPDPRRYLDQAGGGDVRFLAGGLYAKQLARYYRHFSPDRIAVILHEDIGRDPAGVIERVCAHLNVAPHIDQGELAGRKNDGATPMLPLPLRRLLRPMRPLLDPLRRVPALARLRQTMTAPVRYPPLTAELRDMLFAYYREDVAALEDMIDRDLSSWKNPQENPVDHVGAKAA